MTTFLHTVESFFCNCCQKIQPLTKRKVLKVNLNVNLDDPILEELSPNVDRKLVRRAFGKTRIRVKEEVFVCVKCAVEIHVGSFHPSKNVLKSLLSRQPKTTTSSTVSEA